MNTKQGFKDFTDHMKLILDIHQAKKGDSWLACDIEFLEGKLKEELEEYYKAHKGKKKFEELVDVANICMMLYIRRKKEWLDELVRNLPEDFGMEKGR